MSADTMTQLIYVSNSNHFTHETQLKELLSHSRKNNQQQRLTGMLLYHDGLFLQVLEGPEDRVESVYEKIKKDKRHRSCRVIAKLNINERDFADWSMGYRRVDHDLQAGYSEFMNTIDDANQNETQKSIAAYKIMYQFRSRLLNSEKPATKAM